MSVRQFSNFSSQDFDSRIKSNLKHLQREKDFCDVIISCEGRQIEAHKVVLARGSLVFNNILKLNSTTSHPLIFLSDVKFSYLLNILDFMYQGEVSIDKRELDDFLAVARDLKINDITEEAFKDSNPFEERTKKQRLACSPKQELNLDYKIKNENKLNNFHSILKDLKVVGVEDVKQFADEDFDDFEYEEKEDTINISSRQDYNVDFNMKIEHEMENKNTEKNAKKPRLASSPKQQLNHDSKIKNENKLDDFHSILQNLKGDGLEDVEQLADKDFDDDFEDETKSINIKEDTMNISPRQDFNMKIELEMENKNAESNEKTIPTQDVVNANKQYSHELGLRIRDVTKLSETKRQGRYISSEIEHKIYPCIKCDYKATAKQHLKTHTQSIHERKRYPCSHCDYKATTKQSLETHFQSIHEGMRYPCSQCNYKATGKGNLKKHILSTHEGIRYPCSHCDYKATLKSDLKRHFLSIHEGIKYPCSHCDYKAAQKDRLKSHILSIHEGIKYPCSHCDYKATEKNNLKKHIMSIHEGIKKYPCSHCDYKATTKQHLNNHIRSIHE